jgi:hypothetical protein
MKIFLMIAFLCIQAFAETQAVDPTDLAMGLECSMKYSNSNPFQPQTIVSTAWMVAGSELVGEAYNTDGDGNYTAEIPSNSIVVSEQKIGLEDYWTITVYNSEKSVLGIINLPKVDPIAGESASMRASFNVNAFEEGSEDPRSFDVLDVACFNTGFAG